MTGVPIPDWMADSPACTTLEITAGFRIFDSLYVGPVNAFSPEQWRTLRVPLPIEGLPLFEGNLLLASSDVSVEQLTAYYRRLLDLAVHHARPLTAASLELSIKPWIVAEGAPTCCFPWTDRHADTQRVFSILAASDADGVLLDDLDQHWEVHIARKADEIWFGERDWESASTNARTARAPVERVRAQAASAARRLDELVGQLEHALGGPVWTAP